ncbi:hypothetical protein BCV69DRAFT_67724 [Microstroma glucosiphilum]|uniref:HIT domain-containing protein n=1 Tax=Pseudomicrostroma glucosiphilum TaxID=1684307 RepID=A0A316U046_9BASI|nr:hypothetical protein BCV69DRAFT_67724 [Pseudomicrostroma glucosiphilum]PWN18600.1 hypothetical protein BCV69DRAFT_67724 [Pseudomicrostroma glucosiphilum]
MAPLSFLKSCFGFAGSNAHSKAQDSTGEGTSALLDSAGTNTRSTSSGRPCIFCNIPPMSDPNSPFKVVMENEEAVAFHDRSPKGVLHLLAVPRVHVKDVKALQGAEGAAMVQRLVDIGTQALDLLESQRPSSSPDTRSESKRRLGFHVPPLTSVSHLHLHCLVEPLSMLGRMEFPVAPAKPEAKPPLLKGYSWFVEAEQARTILQSGKKVTVGKVTA